MSISLKSPSCRGVRLVEVILIKIICRDNDIKDGMSVLSGFTAYLNVVVLSISLVKCHDNNILLFTLFGKAEIVSFKIHNFIWLSLKVLCLNHSPSKSGKAVIAGSPKGKA